MAHPGSHPTAQAHQDMFSCVAYTHTCSDFQTWPSRPTPQTQMKSVTVPGNPRWNGASSVLSQGANSDQLYLNVAPPTPTPCPLTKVVRRARAGQTPPLVLIFHAMQHADSSQPSIFTPLWFFSLQSFASCTLRSLPAWQPPITWFQTQLILTTTSATTAIVRSCSTGQL